MSKSRGDNRMDSAWRLRLPLAIAGEACWSIAPAFRLTKPVGSCCSAKTREQYMLGVCSGTVGRLNPARKALQVCCVLGPLASTSGVSSMRNILRETLLRFTSETDIAKKRNFTVCDHDAVLSLYEHGDVKRQATREWCASCGDCDDFEARQNQ